jgi:FtsH-binding integral membrane protein
MLLIAAIGIDLGAIAAVFSSPSIWGSVALYAVTVGLLATSLVGAALRRGAEQAPWLGIAVFGWLFLLPGIALTMRQDPWTRAGVFLGAQVFGLIGGGVARLFSRN